MENVGVRVLLGSGPQRPGLWVFPQGYGVSWTNPAAKVPDACGAIVRGGGNEQTIWGETGRSHPILMKASRGNRIR